MNYRKFALINSSNSTLDLTDSSSQIFASNPKGLGLNMTTSFSRVGDINNLTYELYGFVEKQFELLFTGTNDEIYTNYYSFMTFVADKNLTLQYTLANGDVYYMDVYLSVVDKTEVDKDGMLHCSITLIPKSLWYSSANTSTTTASSTSASASVSVSGNVETSLIYQITSSGTVTNPSLEFYDSNGTQYGAAKFNGTFTSVYVDTGENTQTIILTDSSGTTIERPYNYQDLTVGSSSDGIVVTFPKLQLGTNTVEVSCDSASSGFTLTLIWYDLYASV